MLRRNCRDTSTAYHFCGCRKLRDTYRLYLELYQRLHAACVYVFFPQGSGLQDFDLRALLEGTAAHVLFTTRRKRQRRHLSSKFGTKNFTWRNCSACFFPQGLWLLGWRDTFRLYLELRTLPWGTASRVLSTRVRAARIRLGTTRVWVC